MAGFLRRLIEHLDWVSIVVIEDIELRTLRFRNERTHEVLEVPKDLLGPMMMSPEQMASCQQALPGSFSRSVDRLRLELCEEQQRRRGKEIADATGDDAAKKIGTPLYRIMAAYYRLSMVASTQQQRESYLELAKAHRALMEAAGVDVEAMLKQTEAA